MFSSREACNSFRWKPGDAGHLSPCLAQACQSVSLPSLQGPYCRAESSMLPEGSLQGSPDSSQARVIKYGS